MRTRTHRALERFSTGATPMIKKKQLDLLVLQSAGGAGDEDAGDDDGQDGAWMPQVGGVLEIAEVLT